MQSSNTRAGIPAFDTKLENEEEILEAMLLALSRAELDEALWGELHEAAVQQDRVSELAFAYESVSQGRKLKTLPPPIQAELYFRAAALFGEVLGDEVGATTYLEKALTAWPGHAGAFARIDKHLTKIDDNRKLADLCVHTSSHRPRPEQSQLLRRAAVLYERAGLEEKATETYQQLVKMEPGDAWLRSTLATRYLKANRFRDVARLLEQALVSEPEPEPEDAAGIRARLIDVFANQLQEPERAMPHVEALLAVDPTHAEARRVATRLLESKGLAARAAASLAPGAPTTEERARFIGIELENTRGPKRRDVLRRLGVLKQDELGDVQGAFDVYEQALGIDPSDDELRRRYIDLGSQLKGPLEVAKTLTRIVTLAKDAAVRSRITAEIGASLLRGGDTKRGRATLTGVLSAATADPHATLIAARALEAVYEAEKDVKSLVEVLSRIGELSEEPEEKQRANERVAELCTTELGDTERAIAAWRRLTETSARDRALEALEPLYEAREDWVDLAFVLEERAKALTDRQQARALSFRAAEVLTHKAKDRAGATEVWRHMVQTYGPARDIHAEWMPLLEAARQWTELAEVLVSDASLTPREEQAPVLARLGLVYLTRTRDAEAAIDAFRRALAVDPREETSRTTLEKLLGAGDHRLGAAAVLEPIYRQENEHHGLLRVLELKAQLATDPSDRLAALEEAAEVAVSVSRDKTLEVVGRGLREAVDSDAALAPWLERFDTFAVDADRARRASILAKGLGEHAVERPEHLVLATRVGEELALAGDVAAALGAFRRALAYQPSSAELTRRVDELLREQGNPEERVALYRASLESAPDASRRKELLHSIGTVERHELSNPDAAILAYQRALKDDPADAMATEALTELFTETDAWDDLAGVLEARLPHATSEEESRRVRGRLAEVLASHGHGERAIAHARTLLEDTDLEAADLDVVERVAVSLEDVPLQRTVLERRVREAAEPEVQVACLKRLSALDFAAGEIKRAAERLRQAADVAGGMGDEATAIALLVELRGMEPDDVAAATQLVELFERTGEYARAAETIGVLLELPAPAAERVALLMRLTELQANKLHDLPAAFDAARRALLIAPGDREVLGMAEAMAVRSRSGAAFAAAVEEAAEALMDDARGPGGETPQTAVELKLARARVLSSSPETLAEAVLAYRALLEDDAASAAHAGVAELLEAALGGVPAGDELTAHVRWLHAWRSEHGSPEERGTALARWARVEETELGDPARALSLYRRVVEQDPDDSEALDAMSRLALAQGDVEGALDALIARRKAAEGEAQQALDVQIATVLASLPGRASEALDRVASVLGKAPHDAQALRLAARLLRDPELTQRASSILETSIEAVEDEGERVEILGLLLAHGVPGADSRLAHYQRLLDILASTERNEEAYEVVLRAAKELPHEPTLWDRAEALARQLASADPLAALYEQVLRSNLPVAAAAELGQRAVAFYEEWFEDGSRVVGILQRLLEIDPSDTWAFDRLKLLFDAQERWDELFELYDRAAAGADEDRRVELLEEAAQTAKDFANHSQRAIGYLEQLIALKPNNNRLSAALERLYERHGCHRELITLRGNRVGLLLPEEAQKEVGSSRVDLQACKLEYSIVSPK